MREKQPVLLQVLPALHSGGVERGTVEIARAAVKAGFKSLVASQGGYMEAEIKKHGGIVFNLPLKSKNPFVIWRNIKKLEEIIRKEKVDVVHARSRAPAWSAYFAAKRTGCHFITTFHGLYSIQNKWKLKYNSVMVRGEKVVAISEFIKEHIIENYGVDEAKIKVIYRGVDFQQFHCRKMNSERKIKLINTCSLPDDMPIITLPGRITRWKGQKFLLESLQLLPHRNFFCIFVGDENQHPKYAAELKEAIHSLSLEKNCRLVGNIMDMPALYMLSSIVISASIKPEAFGRVATEAMAMGRPLIATNIGASCETVIDGVTGWLVQPGNTKQMAEKIDEVLAMSREELDKIGENAMRHVGENFTSDEMYGKTIELYREVITPHIYSYNPGEAADLSTRFGIANIA